MQNVNNSMYLYTVCEKKYNYEMRPLPQRVRKMYDAWRTFVIIFITAYEKIIKKCCKKLEAVEAVFMLGS